MRRAHLWALLALGPAACSLDGDSPAWVTVKKDDLILGVEVTGTLRAVDSTAIKPPIMSQRWDFKIARMADEGAEVKKGDVVLAFDASDLVRELEQAKNEADAAAEKIAKTRSDAAMQARDLELRIAEAEANLRKATLKAERPEDLVATIEVQTAELDRKVAELELAHAKKKAESARRQAATQIAALKETLAYYESRVREIQAGIAQFMVRSPRDGTVIYPTNWRGEKKKVGDSVWRMETVLEIVSLDKMVGEGVVDEVDSSKIAEGQTVSVRVDAHGDTELRGRLDTIAKTVQPQSPANPARIVQIEIALDDSRGLPLRPGMRFRGQVETGRVEGAVVVPAEAVFIKPRGPVAYRRDGNGFVTVPLELGARNDRFIQVTSGLSPGDEVARVEPEGAK